MMNFLVLRSRQNSGLRIFYQRDEGASLIETALLLPVFVLMLVGAIDFGRGYYMAMEVTSAAEAGALYGVQNPTDTAGMIAAAKADATDTITLIPIASYGCECSDGTSIEASCASTPACGLNVVDYVQVNTTAIYLPLLNYPGIPSPMTLSSTARMRSAHQ